jgi:hypothetical protein
VSFRPRPKRAMVNPGNPRAWATCQGCGLINNLHRLQWQYEWTGPQLFNTRVLRCELCINKPNELLRTIVIPPDPDPLVYALPENYGVDEAPGLRVLADRHALRIVIKAPGVRGGPRVVSGTTSLQTSF